MEMLEPRLLMAGDFILELATVANDGTQGNDFVFEPEISGNGRYVVFASRADNLVPGDTNDKEDIFVFDRVGKTIERVSVGMGGAESNDHSGEPAITNDGRYVVFQSRATNLVSNTDSNGGNDIFVYDRDMHTTTLISRTTGGAAGNMESTLPDIAGDGRYVAFASAASNLVSGDSNQTTDIFVYDMVMDKMERVNVTSSGAQTTGHQVNGSDAPYDSNDPSISDDGRYVAFDTQAENLGSDGNNLRDVYVRDRVMNKTEKISVGATTLGNQGSFFPTISGDGNFVAFSSRASNLAGDLNGTTQVLLRDRVAKTTVIVSKNPTTNVPATSSANSFPSVSFDGRYIGFDTSASNLVDNDTNGREDAFVYDRVMNTLEIVSRAADGTPGDAFSDHPVVSSDGRIVAFRTTATNIAPGDANGTYDIIVRSPDTSFKINSTSDAPDSNPGDGLPFTANMIMVDGQLVPEVTLRSAIMEANADADLNAITFDIPMADTGFDAGVSAFVIKPATPINTITNPVTIEGFSQAQAKKATATTTAELKIQLDGSLLPANDDSSIGLEVETDGTLIEGLSIVKFGGAGIFVHNAQNVTLRGNNLGVNAKGTAMVDAQGKTALGNANGVRLNGAANAIIGGDMPADRNVISGNLNDGIWVEVASAGTKIRNNVIGLDAAATNAIGNGGDGIVIENAANVDIGGVTPERQNIIAGNFGAGIRLLGTSTHDTLIQGNLIGTNTVDNPLIGNIDGGVIIDGAHDNTIGGAVANAPNVISYNGLNAFSSNLHAAGVHVIRGDNNAIISNTFVLNLGLGIDLGAAGVTRNQDTPTNLQTSQMGMTGNGLTNFPVLTVAENGLIRTVLHAEPNTTYRIEYYTSDIPDETHNGEGDALLGSVTVMTNAMGDVETTPASLTVPVDKWVSATATVIGAGAILMSTSEFSQAVKRGHNPGFTVVMHGYQFQPPLSDGDALLGLAQAIATRTGGVVADYDLDTQGGQGVFQTPVDTSKHTVLLFDWAAESNETSPGWAEAAGDALLAILVQTGLLDPRTGAAAGPFHLIAHSFGAAVISEMVERLAVYGVPVDHVTFLDPHDFDETAIPVDDSQDEFTLGRPQFTDPNHLTQNYGATVWNNVVYAETYFQTRSIASGPNFIVPEGRPILGSFNYFLDGNAQLPNADGVFAPYSGTGNDHTWVWDSFYRGTVEGNGGRTQVDATHDYPPETTPPLYDALGYSFSRALGGESERPTPQFPTGPIGQEDGPNEWTHPALLVNFSDPAMKFEPQWNAHSIVNGDFEAPGTQFTGNLADIVPGWSHHGGGGDGDIEPDRDEDSAENHYLELDFDIASAGQIRTHNFTYVPHIYQNLFLEFDTWRTTASSDDILMVYMDDGMGHRTNIAALPQNATDTGFIHQSFAVPPALQGTAQTITFEIMNNGFAVDSVVRIDNVQWGDSKTGVSGVKFDDKNADGVKDPGEGAPSESFTIYADLNLNGMLDVDEPSTMTRADGAYVLSLPPGVYTINELPKAGWTRTTPNISGVTVGADAITPDINFGNFKNMRVAGIKYDDKNGNGMMDAGEMPIANWLFRLTDSKGHELETMTDGNGVYEFKDLGPGDIGDPIDFYVIEEDIPDDYQQTEAPDNALINIESGYDHSDLNFGNFKKMNISGHKWVDSNGNGIHDAGEPAAAGWEIHLEFPTGIGGSFLPFASTTTDANGFYSFDDVGLTPEQIDMPDRTFRLTETLKNGWTDQSKPATQNIMSGMNYVDMDFVNFELMIVRGVKFEDDNGNGFKDAGEDGIGGFTIEVDIDNDGVADYSTVTATDGTYEIKDILPRDDNTPGDFTVRELPDPDWHQTLPPRQGGDTPGVYTHTIASGGKFLTDDFGNFELMTLAGFKFDDLDGDGALDPEEPGLAGWTIELDLGDGSPVRTFVTGADGFYHFDNVPPRSDGTAGNFTLRERPQDGYTLVAPQAGQYVFPIESGYFNEDLDFANFKKITLTGVKFADYNNDAVRQDNERGLKNWTIQLDLNNDGTIDRTTVTDNDGRYVFNDVPNGTHKITEVAQVGWTQTLPAPGEPDNGAYIVEAKSGENRSELDFGNHPVVSVIAGTKYNDVNRSGAIDTGEVGIANWLIYLDANNNGVLDNPVSGDNVADEFATEPFDFTDEKGNYVFVVNPGAYVVREVVRENWQQSAPLSPDFFAVVVEQTGQSFAPLDFLNFELRSIAGTVFDDLDGDGARDAGEPGLSGWTVELRNSGGTVIDTKMTDANGAYRFTGMDPGVYSVTQVLQPDYTRTFPGVGAAGHTQIDVTQPIQVDNLDFGNFEDMTIRGVKFADLDGDGVRDAGEPGLAGFVIELDIDQDGVADYSATTDATGFYEMTGVGPRMPFAAGKFTLREVARDGFVQTAPAAPGTFEIDIESGLVSDLNDFGNFQLAVVRGFVFNDEDQNGQRAQAEVGIPGVSVFADLDGDGNWDEGDEPIAVSGADGAYELIDLPRQQFVVRVLAPDNYIQTAPAGGNFAVNVATSGQSFDDRNFGFFRPGIDIDFGDGNVASIVLFDNDEIHTVTLKGGVGVLRVMGQNVTTEQDKKSVIVRGDNLFVAEIAIDESDLKTALDFKVKGGSRIMDVGDILVANSIGAIKGKAANVANVTIEHTAKTLEFNNISGGQISIGAPESSKDTISFTANVVSETQLVSLTPLKSLKVSAWRDRIGAAEEIRAPWIGSVSSNGNNKQSIPGDFEADLVLSGEGAGKQTLGKFSAEAVDGSVFDITGDVGSIAIKGDAKNWDLTLASTFKSIAMGAASNVNIDVPDDGGTIKAARWLSGEYVGKSLKGLTVSGDRSHGIYGDLSIDIALTGHSDARKDTLGKVKVLRDIQGGTWNIEGNASGVDAESFDSDWSAVFTGDVKSLTAKLDLSGHVTANSIKSVSAKQDAVDLILTLTQEVDAASSKTIALSKLSVKGVIDNTLVRAAGHIGSVSAGAMFDSLIFAGVSSGLTGLPQGVEDFIAQANFKQVSIKGIKDVPLAFVNSHLAAWTIDKAVIGDTDSLNGGVPFGAAAHEVTSLKIALPFGDIQFKNVTLANAPAPLDDLSLNLV